MRLFINRTAAAIAKAAGVTAFACLGLSFLPRMACADPNDVVPRGDVAYDQLGSLAASGLLPGFTLRDFARGDRLYTRAEFASAIRAAVREAGTDLRPESPYAVALRALRTRFSPELRLLSPDDFRPDEGVPAATSLLTGQAKLRVASGPAQGQLFGRASATLPAGRDGFASVSVGDWRSEWYRFQDTAGVRSGNRYAAIETAFVRVNGRALDVTIGRSPLRWGAGYSGPLALGDEAGAIDRIQVEKGFSLPGTLGRRAGRLYFTQFAGQFFERDIPSAPADARGTRRYLAGRRLEARGGRWTFSVAELLKSTRLPDPQWAMVMPFYLYQHNWTKGSRSRPFGFLATGALPDTFWFNYVGDAQVSYQVDGRTGATVYGDLLLDDVKAPRGWGFGDDTPSKTGTQLGVYLPRLDRAGRTSLRLEYTSLDAPTYTDVSRPIQWTAADTLPLGHPAGPDTRTLFARLDYAVSDRLRLAVEGMDSRRRSGGGGAFPGFTRYASRYVDLFASYAVRRDAFVGARYQNRQGTSNRFEVNVGAGF
jgi:hypothetical protein